jgi:hypothetical protein
VAGLMPRPAPLCRKCRKRPATGPDRERDLTWRRTICDECRREYIVTDAIAIVAAAAAQRNAGPP